MTDRKANLTSAGKIPAATQNERIVNAMIEGIAGGLAGRSRARERIPPDTTIVIHDKEEGSVSADFVHVRTRSIVQRAMALLEAWKFQPASIRGSRLPVDIIALRGDVDMLVQVISSKHPIPDAKTLVEHYRKKINALRQMGTAARFRKILMAHSVPCGWKHYDVLPGGLMPAWDLHKLPTG